MQAAVLMLLEDLKAAVAKSDWTAVVGDTHV